MLDKKSVCEFLSDSGNIDREVLSAVLQGVRSLPEPDEPIHLILASFDVEARRLKDRRLED